MFPFFVATMQPVVPARRLRVTIRELLIALAVLVIALFAGQYMSDLRQGLPLGFGRKPKDTFAENAKRTVQTD